MNPLNAAGSPGSLRSKTYRVIFLHDTPSGKAFDVVLILAILLSVAAVMVESVQSIEVTYGSLLRALEWLLTALFTAEYVLRIWSVDKPRSYAWSFFGMVDLLAVLPTYLSVLLPGGQVLIVIRILRVIRVFRVLKLAQFVGEANLLGAALRAARYKITVFLISVVSIVVIVGSIMYLVEGPAAGFTSIPRGVYWGIVTLTTVGYGNIAPVMRRMTRRRSSAVTAAPSSPAYPAEGTATPAGLLQRHPAPAAGSATPPPAPPAGIQTASPSSPG